jgi:serine/threonine-protein kinase
LRSSVGHYRIEGLIGRGGMGMVYRGVHDHLGRAVAIKELAPELTQQPEFKERFFAEAKTQAHLHHPNIAAVYDLVEEAGEYFIVMELVPGEGLDHLLQASVGSGMPLGHALGIFSQILAALDYAHSEGVIHRDVKPSNALVTAQGRVKLMDFGIALLIGDKRLTASQASIGTPIYMSPEQILYPRTVDHRSDIYSAAVVLFEMLAGQPPFDGDSEYAIKKLQIESPPPDLAALKPDLPPGVLRALSMALNKAPDDRFPSAGAFLRALQEVAPAALATPAHGAMPPVLQPILAPPPTGQGAAPLPGAATDAGRRSGSGYGPAGLLHGRAPWLLAAVGALVVVGTALILALVLRSPLTAPSPPSSPAVAPVATSSTTPSPSRREQNPVSQPSQSVLAAAQLPVSAPGPATPVAAESSAPVMEAPIVKPKKPSSHPSENARPAQPNPVAPVPVPLPAPPVAVTGSAVTPEGKHTASAAPSDPRASELGRMKDVIDTLASLADTVYDTAEHDPQKTNSGLRLLGDFSSSVDELRSTYQKATGNGVRDQTGRLRPHDSPETNQAKLKVEARDIVRRAKEIGAVLRRDPMGPTTAEYWSEIEKRIATLDSLIR